MPIEKKNDFDRSVTDDDIVGDHLKKGSGSDWFRAGVLADTDAPLAVIMDTMRMGEVLWVNNKISKIEADFVIKTGVPDGDSVRSGWNTYSSVQLVDQTGMVMTFTSSSWGGKDALDDLIPPYIKRGQTSFPVVKLASRTRNNQYSTVDPVFQIIDWLDRSKFEAILGPAAHEVPVIAPPEEPAKEEPRKPARPADIIDDDIPF